MDLSDEGAELDNRWAEAATNVCGVVRNHRDASTVAARFVRAGWSSSSSSWSGYEVETSWCRLEIEPVDGTDLLLNGFVDPARLDDLSRLLGAPHALELHAEDGTLLHELTG
ncbi:hypothetical protein [Streptomyces showdoensis]|uniref:Uncharacterized protein n=1 Tax=Streptomyces showdoensis TaxID=68268 RepID=A0A2P2GKW9_STREW|nr:hypothetical protein [Streptomyces showdoensis]KKZ72161.1 hypothetical protein VO63_19385 [Streptomyces showdoensis]